MKFAKSRITGAILLILSIALIFTGVFAAKAPNEGPPFPPAYAQAANEQAALTAAQDAVASAIEELERTGKRAADAMEASIAAVESAQAAFEAESTGNYDSETDVGKLGQSILEAHSAGADVSGILADYSPVYNAEVIEEIAGAQKEVDRAQKAVDGALTALQTAVDSALALNAESALPGMPAIAAANPATDSSLIGAAALLNQAEVLLEQSETAQLNAETLNAEGAAILDAVNAIIAANPVSAQSKLISLANARAVDLMTIGGILFAGAALLLLSGKLQASGEKT